MKHIVLVASDGGLLLDTLENSIRNLNYEVTRIRSDADSINGVSKKVDAYVIFATDSLSFRSVAAMNMSNKIMSHGTPSFLIGNRENIDIIQRQFSDIQFVKIFERPVAVKVVAQDIDFFLTIALETARKKILVVDDSGPMLRSVNEWFGDRYTVILANSGLAAIRQLSANRPDLILLDYQMPICNGAQVLEMLRADPEMADIPVMFLTSNDKQQDVQRAVSLEPQGYLLKTLPKEEIVAAVDAFFVNQGC